MLTPSKPLYVYSATVLNIHDGDTVKLAIKLRKVPKGWPAADLGFRFHVQDGFLTVNTSIRLLGINAPELATPEGVLAVTFLRTLIKVGDSVMVRSALATQSINPDKYGDRWLGVIAVPGAAASINDQMLLSNNAAAWNGKGVKPLPTV